jgi:hypothetical protein
LFTISGICGLPANDPGIWVHAMFWSRAAAFYLGNRGGLPKDACRNQMNRMAYGGDQNLTHLRGGYAHRENGEQANDGAKRARA